MKIAVLGAAGVRTPLIVQAMAIRQARLGLDELALMDIDGERLALIGALTAPLERDEQVRFKVTRTTQAAEALKAADFVITTFRVGGIQSRVIDERVPLELGVLGQETTGPGGFAMGLRSIPVILDYVRQMRELCPNAWLVNFANPAGMLAEAVARSGWERVAGICDAPHSMGRVAAAFTGAPPGDVFLDYFGLNHLGWVRSVIYDGRDYLPQFIQMLQQAGGMPGLPFDPAFVAELGMIPNEYLYYYYYSQTAVANILAAGPTRGERIAALNEQLFAELKRLQAGGDEAGMLAAYRAYLDQRGQTYMVSETGQSHDLSAFEPAVAEALAGEGYAGVALDLIEALKGSQPHAMVLNIPNRGAVLGMGELDVVEIPAYVGRGVIRPIAVGSLPPACLGLMQTVKAYEQLTIQAALTGSYQQALQALVIHPLVGDYQLAQAILKGYISQHGAYFPALS